MLFLPDAWNALRFRLEKALDAFRQKVYENNYAEFKHVLHWANSQFEPFTHDNEDDDSLEDQVAARFDAVYDEYFHADLYHAIPRAAFAHLVDGTDIDKLAKPEIARRFVPDGTTTPPEAEEFEQCFEKLQSQLTAAAAAGEVALLPNEYRTIMSLVGSVLPCGTSIASNVSALCCYLSPLYSVEVPPLSEVIERLALGPDLGDWTVYAGCITWRESYDNETTCGLVLCEKKSNGNGQGRHKAWRIFVARHNMEAEEFESFEEFLNWYYEYGRKDW